MGSPELFAVGMYRTCNRSYHMLHASRGGTDRTLCGLIDRVRDASLDGPAALHRLEAAAEAATPACSVCRKRLRKFLDPVTRLGDLANKRPPRPRR